MPFAMTKGSTTYFLAYDQVGSLRAVADSLGTVVKQIDYDSFGNILNDTNQDLKIPFGFAGGLHDRDTGLVRFGYRDYDPDTGRWTAKDPIGFKGGTDLYGYCVNDPVNLADYDGLAWITVYAEANHHNSSAGSSASSFGHGFVGIQDDNGRPMGGMDAMGNYPASERHREGTNDDTHRIPDATSQYTWEITQEEADAALQAMQSDHYNFATDNCISRVQAALDAAGIYHPSFGVMGIPIPKLLDRWLSDLNRFTPCR